MSALLKVQTLECTLCLDISSLSSSGRQPDSLAAALVAQQKHKLVINSATSLAVATRQTLCSNQQRMSKSVMAFCLLLLLIYTNREYTVKDDSIVTHQHE